MQANLMLQAIALVPLILVFASTCLFIFMYFEMGRLWKKGDAMSLVTLLEGENDNAVATSMFVALIERAETEIEVFDDGNKMDESVYQNPTVIAALQEKLESNPSFKATFYFNSDDRTEFRKAFDDYSGSVEIHAGTAIRPDIQTHYKIIDGGLEGYLSKHAFNDGEREFSHYDCRKVPQEMLAVVTDLLFAKIRQEVREQRFSSDAMAEAA